MSPNRSGALGLRIRLALLGLFPLLACAPRDARREYLYLWTQSADTTAPDFLAVLDVTEDSSVYGRLVTTVPVPGRYNRPHHTEYQLATDGLLFANGFASGQSYRFDLSDPAAPKLVGQFGDLAGYSHPHSYIRLANGNRLITFQARHEGERERAGGLVEVTAGGGLVRSASADEPGADSGRRVYSAAVVASLDRIVTTTTDMNDTPALGREIQIWRLSDLRLLHTFPLPDGPAGGEGELSAEPRVLADGKTVLVSTFNCGLFLLGDLETDAPSARLVASFPRKPETSCAVPAVAGKYYLVTVPAWSAVVSLDVSDPTAPREVGRVTFGPDDVPHWIAISPDQRRVVITGYRGLFRRVIIARLDPATGALGIDERFKEPGATEPGFRMEGKTWPHGGTAAGIPHGAVFGPKGKS